MMFPLATAVCYPDFYILQEPFCHVAGVFGLQGFTNEHLMLVSMSDKNSTGF